ncbi:L domain-like protein [Martensiomyces pterosporus]|nr:L domain-like protein [Martensiomyces pterosporus]
MMDSMGTDSARGTVPTTNNAGSNDHYTNNNSGSSSSNSDELVDDGGTFIVNAAAANTGSSDSGARNRGFPIPASEINHMFSPLSIELMFQRSPSAGDSNSDTRASASITGMLWRNGSRNSDGMSSNTMGEQGNTLKQLLSNGSNPSPHDGTNGQRMQGAPAITAVRNSSLVTPTSPPETVTSHASMQSQITGYPTSALPYSAGGIPLLTLSNLSLHGSQRGNQRLPPIPSSPHLGTPSRQSLSSTASSTASMHRKPLPEKPARSANPGAADRTRGGAPPIGGPSALPPQLPHASRRGAGIVDRRLGHRPATMYEVMPNEHSFSPIHSSIGPGQRQQTAGPMLRQEVLDKAARRSQPTTPFDPHSPALSSSSSKRPMSMMQRLPPSTVHPVAGRSPPNDDNTVIPGGSRPRAFTWNSLDEGQQQHQQSTRGPQRMQHNVQPRRRQLPLSHQVAASQIGAGLIRPASTTLYGATKLPESAAALHGRKASDGSAQLLTPKDFDVPLPDRIGDMVLDKEIGEWVHIDDLAHLSAAGSPLTRSPTSAHLDSQQTMAKVPSSARSSISTHSHTSAFPQPLPTEKEDGHDSYGTGLVSPASNQHRAVREMVERKGVSRRESTLRSRRGSEDEALGSIVHRLMTPTASPDGTVELNLAGSGIRNLEGLSQTASHLESIYLDRNKLQGLSGLPMTLVNLTASSNWIRFSASDKNKFRFASELPHLENVDLSSNEISDISVFSGLTHLRVLVLSRNRMESLGGLRRCRKLALLRLRDNYVTDFDLDPSEVPLLDTIDLFNNRLRVLPANIAEFERLASINLVKNDLSCVELQWPPAFAVRELKLSENPHVLRKDGGVIDVHAWAEKFPSLKTLYLDTCSIKHLARSTSSSSTSPSAAAWPSLFNLSLRGNATQPELVIDFGCIPNAKNVYAPDTRLLLPQLLPPMRHLRQLVLRNAGLRFLPSNMAEALPHLEQLDICNNPDLADMGPLPKLMSLVSLMCRAVPFSKAGHAQVVEELPKAPVAGKRPASGGLEAFPEIDYELSESQIMSGSGGGNSSAWGDAADEIRTLQSLKNLKRLKVLDLRFNQGTNDLYAPAPHSTLVLPSDGLYSPEASSQRVFGDVDAMAGPGWRSRSSTMTQCANGSGGPPPVRVDEAAWRRRDAAFWSHVNQTQQQSISYRRMVYRRAAKSMFPQLETLDGIKCNDH